MGHLAAWCTKIDPEQRRTGGDGDIAQFGKQVLSVLVVAAFAFSVTWVLGKIVDAIIGLRVREDEEVVGLDISQHEERVFGGISS